MDEKKQVAEFHRELLWLALPVTLQSLLHSSFGVVDQIMVGQLGTVSVAGIGMANKFAMLLNVVLGGAGGAAGIMIAQYVGQKNGKGISRSFWVNMVLALSVAAAFVTAGLAAPERILSLYTKDPATQQVGAGYLRIFILWALPTAVTAILSALLRCVGGAKLPLCATALAAVLNSALNYLLIFGKLGFPAMGANGAAWGSVLAQTGGCLLLLIAFARHCRGQGLRLPFTLAMDRPARRQYLAILLPMLGCEVLWGLGENVYAAIYGRIGTAQSAAMTLIGPMISLQVGTLSGLAAAAGVIIGKRLGSGEYDTAYRQSRRLLLYGFFGAVVLGATAVCLSGWYVQIYNVEPEVRTIAVQLILAFAVVAPVKVLNMILGNGILRAGGKTNYIMAIDAIGTWCVGIPLGFLSAFLWKLPIPWVYFILSQEECVRMLLSLGFFVSRKWQKTLA